MQCFAKIVGIVRLTSKGNSFTENMVETQVGLSIQLKDASKKTRFTCIHFLYYSIHVTWRRKCQNVEFNKLLAKHVTSTQEIAHTYKLIFILKKTCYL